MKINVVIIGHVDHGKSTLIGRLLYDSDSITEGRVEEIQKIADEYKRRFEFAYFIDSFDDELKEERTIDTTGVMFKGHQNLYVVSDVPGHKEFIKNMLSGASHAEAAVLVVSAEEGIREQTRRHAFLIKMLGIKHVFVAINKMDLVDYREENYESLNDKVSKLFCLLGLQAEGFVPISAMAGDNVYNKSANMPWYNGKTLIEALDGLKITHEAKPLRFAVQDNYDIDGVNVTVGRVESGTLSKSADIVFQPSGIKTKVTKIMTADGERKQAESGESIGIVTGTNPGRGNVLGPVSNPPVATQSFLGEVVLLDSCLRWGESVHMSLGTSRVSCTVAEIREKINSETGEVLGKNPGCINENEAATIIFHTEPLAVENFIDIPELGRFVLAREKNIGAGIVLDKTA